VDGVNLLSSALLLRNGENRGILVVKVKVGRLIKSECSEVRVVHSYSYTVKHRLGFGSSFTNAFRLVGPRQSVIYRKYSTPTAGAAQLPSEKEKNSKGMMTFALISNKVISDFVANEYGKYLLSVLPKFIQQVSVYKDELTVYCAPSAVETVLHFLRDHTNAQFKQCQDVCGVDYPARADRFEVVYNLLSLRYNTRIRVKTYTDEVKAVPSSCNIYPGNNWFERFVFSIVDAL
jgi:hypothetical protein